MNQKLSKIAQEMKNGKIVIFPTETVYGIGTNAFDERACEKIFKIKERPNEKPLIVLISDFSMLYSMVDEINIIEQKLIDRFWPGPLTIIFKRKKDCNLSNVVTANQDTIGIRMTSGKIARLLIQESGVPIVAPSANLSGRSDGSKINQIYQELRKKVDYIIDCGDIVDMVPSTIVQVMDSKIQILRRGKISEFQIASIIE